MARVLVVAPHADDETLGCGGTLLRHVDSSDEVHWLIVGHMSPEAGFESERIATRVREIETVRNLFGFESVTNLGFPASRLDEIPIAEIVQQIQNVVSRVRPEIFYVPFRADAHTDHTVVFDAAVAASKWFRHPSIHRVLSYEVVSETDFGIRPDSRTFSPNWFVDIGDYLDRKIEIMKTFKGEMGEHPFPRSERSIRALAELRGAAAGFSAAEAFILLKERK